LPGTFGNAVWRAYCWFYSYCFEHSVVKLLLVFCYCCVHRVLRLLLGFLFFCLLICGKKRA
jgi:hypothetical protein